jgi:hypothetical protein
VFHRDKSDLQGVVAIIWSERPTKPAKSKVTHASNAVVRRLNDVNNQDVLQDQNPKALTSGEVIIKIFATGCL